MIDATPSPAGRVPGWRRRRRVELRAAVVIIVAMASAGGVLGLVWAWWSPPGPRALLLPGGQVQPEESEAFVAADGRFALLCLGAGVLAGVLAFTWRAVRGTIVVAGLALGGLAGAGVAAAVGRLSGGGSATGTPGSIVAELPLSVHMPGLLVLQALAAVAVYGLAVSFAVDDDLGRPDPQRDRARHGDQTPAALP